MSRTSAAAALASIAVHAAAVGGVLRFVAPDVERQRSETLEFTLVSVSRPVGAPTSATTPPVAPRSPQVTRTPAKVRRARPVRAPEPHPRPSADPSPSRRAFGAVPGEGFRSDPVIDAPVAASPLAPASSPPPPRVDLFDPSALSKYAPPSLAPASSSGRTSALTRLPGESMGDDAATPEARIAARVSGASLDLDARTRVQTGLVDPSYARLGQHLVKAWDPRRALPEDSAALLAKNQARNAAEFSRVLAEMGSRWARTGSPFADDEPDDSTAAETRDPTSSLGTSIDGSQMRATMKQYVRGKFNEGREALILVSQTPGARPQVRLVKPSGDDDVDRAALDDITRAVTAWERDEPPASPRRSLWSFNLKVIVNYTPVASFTFDEVLGTADVLLPGGRKLLKRVQLRAVYDQDPRFRADAAPTTPAPDSVPP